MCSRRSDHHTPSNVISWNFWATYRSWGGGGAWWLLVKTWTSTTAATHIHAASRGWFKNLVTSTATTTTRTEHRVLLHDGQEEPFISNIKLVLLQTRCCWRPGHRTVATETTYTAADEEKERGGEVVVREERLRSREQLLELTERTKINFAINYCAKRAPCLDRWPFIKTTTTVAEKKKKKKTRRRRSSRAGQ